MGYLSFMICFLASVIGAICGIGGGVIIKPVLDAFGGMDTGTINFLSGCTVLSMTTYSVAKSKISGESHVKVRTGLPLAIGAAAGGIAGKCLFSLLEGMYEKPNVIGEIQAVCLCLITIGTLCYTVFKEKIKTHHVENSIVCAVIGAFLGIISSFLGIGGGPINLVVLFFFFSMSIKAAVENSLYIIFFSQLANLGCNIITKSVPNFTYHVLVWMVVGGILGGIVGRKINKNIDEETVNKLYLGLMVVIIVINICNIYKFHGMK